MSTINYTRFQHQAFLLTGIPGKEDVYCWISIPFCLTYVISIVGNSFIVFVIKTTPSLHEPMYIFLSMLATTDFGISITTMPTILGILLLNSREISLDACFVQVFFIHSFICTQSSVLLFMAFDRLIAICDPLRYASIFTPQRLGKIWLVCVLRGVLVIVPYPILLKRLRYCRENLLSHSVCSYGEVMTMSCSDFTVDSIYGLCITLLTLGLDSLFIFLSYVMILKVILSIASHGERLRALNTCISHLCAVFVFYMPLIVLTFINVFVNGASLVKIFLGMVHIIFPPLMNPIVYSVKTKQLRARIVRIFVK